MKFNSIIRFLLPHEDKFYMFFRQASQNLVDTSELLKKFSSASEGERQDLIRQIQDKEHRGDTITHEIFFELNKTFITPIDREDIHMLASVMDDILDNINGGATRFTLYKMKECTPDTTKLIDILHNSISELQRGINYMHNFDHPEQLRNILKKINEYENEADDIFERAVANLFENEKDPIKIIKLKEIFVSLETATDKCEDAANVLEGLLIKHA